MDLKSSYFVFPLFDKIIKNYDNFSFIQEEIKLKQGDAFEKIKTQYNCILFNKEGIDKNKPLAITSIKNNSSLLRFTLENLKKYKILEQVNFLVIDDRSDENIKLICDEYLCFYMRCDNNKGFNFSILNNLGIKIAYDLGIEDVVLWNSDLWTLSENTLMNLLSLHKKYNSTISGTKLVYPEFTWNGSYETKSINENFLNKKNLFRGTTQFGGSIFYFSPQANTFFPSHLYRFSSPDNFIVNSNKPEFFITGAFNIIKTNWIVNNGGLNPSLSKNFQDVDVCLRVIEDNKKIMYFGENLQLYHDESVTMDKPKQDSQLISDATIYSKIWNKQRFLNSIYREGI